MAHNGTHDRQSSSAPYRDSLSSDLDSISDSGDVTSEHYKSLGGRNGHDQRVLDDEDEQEKLLTGGGGGKSKSSQPSQQHHSSSTRKRRKGERGKSGKDDGEERKELIYDRDVEEGEASSRRSSSLSSSGASSAADREKIGAMQAQQNRSVCFNLPPLDGSGFMED